MIKAYFKPDYVFNTLLAIQPELLRKHQIQTILIDVNNTLIPPENTEISTDFQHWMKTIQNQGINLALISNNSFKKLDQSVTNHSQYFLTYAQKPFLHKVRQFLRHHNIAVDGLCVIGDQVFTDVWLGKRLHALTILVKPLSQRDHLSTHFIRKLEAFVLKETHDTL